jgi:ABC-type sugar transport system ATPase subunit
MESIVKSFGGNRVLDDVSLSVRRGSVHALMGENGAGKSTLMKILGGIHRMDEGLIRIDGQPVNIDTPYAAQTLGISMIHQELSSLPDLSVAANVYLGREPVRGPLRLIDKKRMLTETKIILDEIGSHIPADIDVGRLSVSQAQMVEIAKAISYNSDIIVMDEPTSAITETETANLFRVIRKLKAEGKAIIYISHKIDEIFQIADEITILRDGRHIGTRPAAEISHDHLIMMMVGRELGEQYASKDNAIGEMMLEVRNLTKRNKFRGIGFSVRRGEILGIAGLMGSGRTEIAEAVFGLNPADSGEIWVAGKKADIRSPHDAIGLGLAMVPEDRKLVGLNLVGSVRVNITVANLIKYCLGGQVVRKRAERAVSEHYISALSIKTPSTEHLVGQLSGGNQQKVVLARWLSCNPRILILDEPTRGIDVGAKADIHKLMCAFAAQGNAVVMISSELPEILNMSDRTLVMHAGRVTGEFTRDEITQEAVIACASGLKN